MKSYKQFVVIENVLAVQMICLDGGRFAQACAKCGGAGVVDSKRYYGSNPCERCKTTGHREKIFENEQAVEAWIAKQAARIASK